MPITRIPIISKYRVFKDFAWPADLPDFERFNVILAGNGCGKTTLSHLFRHIQNREPLSNSEGEVRFIFGATEVSGSKLADPGLPPVRVFNRDTVNRSVLEEHTGEFPPVFYLGEESVEKQKEIATLRVRATELTNQMSVARRKADFAESHLESFCIDTARSIKNLLTAPGSPYNNYDKGSFKQSVERMRAGKTAAAPLTDEERSALLQIKDSSHKSLVSAISDQLPDYTKIKIEIEEILATTVVSNVIAELASDSALSSWISAGLNLHIESDKCKFCEQPLPTGRIQRLESHFNDQFQKFQIRLRDMTSLVREAAVLLKKELPNRAEFYDDLVTKYELAHGNLDLALEDGRSVLNIFENLLDMKSREPFGRLAFNYAFPDAAHGRTRNAIRDCVMQGHDKDIRELLGGDAVARVNSLIDLHNERVSNHNKRIAEARAGLERSEVSQQLEGYVGRLEQYTNADTEFTDLQRQAREIQSKITRLESEIRTHQRPAEELNQDLAGYLGNSEISFAVKDTGYIVRRNGITATNLSEGEKTAVAFLYFLKSLSDLAFDLKNGIVVIDDPVSSLDANSLYCAFGYLKHRCADAGQLFILTHNFTLFRLVRNWFRHIKPKKQIGFYMIQVSQSDTGRAAALTSLDPLLQDYESEYQYLFGCVVKACTQISAPGGLASNYGSINIARRVLETFLAFKLPHMGEDLNAKLEIVTFEPAKKARILRFLHVGSHAGHIGQPEHDVSILAETPAVMSDLLALIKSVDPQHYDGMMEKIKS